MNPSTFFVAGLVCVLALLAPQAHAQEARSGTFKTVQGVVTVGQGEVRRAVAPGGGVVEADRIQTGDAGSAVLLLRDGTTIAIGPNTTVDLTRFQFDGMTQEGNLALRVLQGTIRMITGLLGKIQPENVKVTTPASTVSVREDGRPTAVQVQSAAGVVDLTEPYQSAALQRDGRLEAKQLSEEEVKARHGALLALPVLPPSRFTLQFEPGTSTLTADSQSQLPGILEQAAARSGGEILVVGHTDRTGSPQANDVLSLQRAQAIRELLVQRGFDPALIEALGRGEREPVVPTEPNVGRTCPVCRRAIAECVCHIPKRPVGDGIVRVSRETKGRAGKGVTLVKGVPLYDE
eukprot:gene17959-17806_t